MMTYSQFTQYVELHIREYVSEEMMVSSKTRCGKKISK